MPDELPAAATRAFDAHDAYERAAGGPAFVLTTTKFDATVTARDDGEPEWALTYELEVRAPMLSTATADEVGSTVEAGWFDTLALRLEDAPGAVRDSVDITLDVTEEAGDAVATYRFESGDPDRAAAIAKAFAEYVEGTYMEGVVPGYDYQPPVSEMLASARGTGGDEGSGDPMPL
ncbi:DUF5813 family protein [Haloglomus halophilum]|uniref:DUF5813 family protein n=1 Tax=Haloglomus halophilum TaxID=2962672 RepID=UPI0020C978B5|nr:DUF5813 family protein [Haloglomus halophilum]